MAKKNVTPKDCACGCGGTTRGGTFRPGHDAKLLSAMIEAVGGDIGTLRLIVERHVGKPIVTKTARVGAAGEG